MRKMLTTASVVGLLATPFAANATCDYTSANGKWDFYTLDERCTGSITNGNPEALNVEPIIGMEPVADGRPEEPRIVEPGAAAVDEQFHSIVWIGRAFKAP